MLTVYPNNNPWAITDNQIDTLSQQLGKMNKDGRRVFLRFAPEMNGNWMTWGQQPTKFIALWKRLFAAVRRDASLTALVWAPNSGNGYPFGTNSSKLPEDLALLDTNKDGKVDASDDPYAPYYPGDEFVDWVGMSVYYFGPSWPWKDNEVPNANIFQSNVTTAGFYQTYCASKGKPMMIAETNAAYHVNSPSGSGELAIKQAFWKQYITNPSFLNSFPKIKLICLFEFSKTEDVLPNGQPDLRDFRITNNSNIKNAFLSDFSGISVSLTILKT